MRELPDLLLWTRGGSPGRQPPGLRWQPEGPSVAAPLVCNEEPAGFFLVELRAEPTARHLALARALAEPLAVALENDRRLADLEARSQAAEADRIALLGKLGRRTIEQPIIGAEAGLAPVLERAGLAARSDVPVLVLGETGSGKEVIARAIHDRSRRAEGPFLRVNCGAIPPELVDSELFGHERGSFTGAVQTRLGWFERAHGGPLLLDEVGELSLAAQVRLLRVLQEGTLQRVGGAEERQVDVRVIAANHQDLPRMVAERRFREDLWYRLAVFPILLPPLRDRPEDVAPLARHFAERAARRFGLPVRLPDEADERLLRAYAWPGNVRELASVIERAAILGDGRRLEIARALGSATSPEPAPVTDHFPTLDEATAAHIALALERCGGRIEGSRGAARLLAVNPHTLRSRIRKLGLDGRRFREEA